MPIRILIAPDKFKGSLTSFELCSLIEKGLRMASPDFHIVQLPLADGGDGLLEIITHYTPSEMLEEEVQDPLSRPVRAGWLLSADGQTAFIEMARASGLSLLDPREYDPLLSSTYGTGQLIGAAIRSGVKEIILGIGGSATNDGGIGMAAALGYRFLDAKGKELRPSGGSLLQLARIEAPPGFEGKGRQGGKDGPEWKDIRIRVACDVRNPLCGSLGATRVYGPQKGAGPREIEILEEGMLNLVELLKKDLGLDLANREGAGAAGGLGAGCMAFLGAELVRGVDLVMEYSKAARHIAEADWIITGEGKMDGQTLQGKLVAGIAELGRQSGKRVIAICGTLDLTVSELQQTGLTAAFSILPRPMSLEEALQNGASFLLETAYNIGNLLKQTGGRQGE
ncbi:glycerate kinase [Flavitalea flava]